MNTFTHEVQHLGLSIAHPLAQAYDFLCQPANFAAWASGLGTLRQAGMDWVADTPQGELKIRFSPRNALGVLDHWVTLPAGQTVYVPMRVVENGAGCELSLTLFRQPGMSEAQFAADADWVRRDFETLRRLLEGAPA